MNTLLAKLGSICEQKLLQEKILVSPSFDAGRQILQALALAGFSILNLRVETLHSLALKTCRTELNQKRLVSDSVGAHLLDQIVKQLSAQGKLSYFGTLGVTPGLSSALFQAVKELRLAGLTAADLDPSNFICAEKGHDVRLILQEYLSTLSRLDYLDEAELYSLGTKLPAQSQQLFLIPASLTVKPVQRKFLEALCSNRFEYLGFTPVKSLDFPRERFCPGNTNLDTVRPHAPFAALGRLYDLDPQETIRALPEIAMFRAYGESNEVREVIRRIRAGRYKLDQVTVISTEAEPYSQLMYNLSQSLGLPISFGDGLLLSNTRPGRLVRGLVGWIESDYSVAALYPILSGGCFELAEEKALLPAANLLRSAGIGWGRERYGRVLNNMSASLSPESPAEKRELLNWTRELVAELFYLLPQVDFGGLVNYGDLLRGISGLVEKYAAVRGVFDVEGKQSICESLQTIADTASYNITLKEGLDGVLCSVQGLRVGRSGPQAGRLHVCSLRSGIYPARSCNFVVGLEASKFPGQVKEHPVLLDLEKERLGLALAKERPKQSLYDMVQLLASLNGELTLSYPAYNTSENRTGFPSALLLQVYRLISGDKAKDYSALLAFLGENKGFVPAAGDWMDENELWLERAFTGHEVKQALPKILSRYSGLQAGLHAQACRLESEFGDYDGRVEGVGPDQDPRQNPAKIMSCSQLETLAKCPFKYFLRYLLQVEPPRETGFDPGVWLDAAQRGSLLHLIFELFYRDHLPPGEKPKLAKHEGLLYGLAEKLLARKREEIPPPSEFIFEYERREILESCRVFLASEENAAGTPTYFELSFGMKEESNGLGELPPVRISLPDGQVVRLRGRIDRVDLEQDGSLSILDYKTGSTYLYNPRQPFRSGRLLQHAFYSIALEQLLLDRQIMLNPRVAKAGYLFPSLKGEGQRILYDQGNRRPVYELVENLCGILARGAFVLTNDGDDCKFCDYTLVCEANLFQAAVKDMLGQSSNSALEFFRRLKTYA